MSQHTIKQKMQTLQEKVAWFEGEDFSLDEAARRFDEVEAIVADIEQELDGMKQHIEVIERRFMPDDKKGKTLQA